MIAFSNAKINLGLSVTEKRSDGYHNIQSILYPVPWCDIIEIIPSKEFSFNSTGISCPQEDNLCIQAYQLLKHKYSLSPVSIHLHKKIPMKSGLGGGSSNATFTIKILQQKYFNYNYLMKIC